MKVLVDTNVVLDILLERSEFYKDSLRAITKALKNHYQVYFSSSSITDVYYIIRKQCGSREKALEGIKRLVTIFNLAEVNENSILKALISPINDYEDALLDVIATNIKADCIITRNTDDFIQSQNKIVDPLYFCDNM